MWTSRTSARTMPTMSSIEGSKAPALLAREAAEGAGEHTDVRRRDVAVDDEIGAVPLAPGLDVVGHAPDAEEVFRLEEQQAVLPAEPLARPHLVPHGRKTLVSQAHGPTSWTDEHRKSLAQQHEIADRPVGLTLCVDGGRCQAWSRAGELQWGRGRLPGRGADAILPPLVPRSMNSNTGGSRWSDAGSW